MKVNHAQAYSMIIKYIRANLVPLLKGSPGMGKSELVASIARQFNLLLIDLRLAQCDPTDLLGFPSIDVDGGRARYVPMETFPLEGDELPINPITGEQYAGWLLFLDEFTSTGNAVQAASYKIVLDRMVGQRKLHKNVAIVCAGNKETDGAIVNPLSTALQSRLLHMELVMDPLGWIDWANQTGFDNRIPDYIGHRKDHLYTFSPDHQDETYACGRTWAFADRIMKITEDNDPDRLPMLAGAITEGMAREFMAFCQIYNDIPKMEEIEKYPEHTKVPDESSVLYALTGSISAHMNKTNADTLMKYLNRIPKEFQVVTMRSTIRRNKAIGAVPAVQKWVSESAAELY
jgi:hypothetical protein